MFFHKFTYVCLRLCYVNEFSFTYFPICPGITIKWMVPPLSLKLLRTRSEIPLFSLALDIVCGHEITKHISLTSEVLLRVHSCHQQLLLSAWLTLWSGSKIDISLATAQSLCFWKRLWTRSTPSHWIYDAWGSTNTFLVSQTESWSPKKLQCRTALSTGTDNSWN